jgi:Transglycosylase SLT domain
LPCVFCERIFACYSSWMPTDWINRCGAVPYRVHENGAIEAQGYGFIAWDPNGTAEEKLHVKRIVKIWERWQEGILAATEKHGYVPAWVVAIIHNESSGDPSSRAACEEKYCTALWRNGRCEAQGGPEKWCAGGLMAFTSETASMYGHKGPNSWTYYIDHPEEMIVDSVHLMKKNQIMCGGDIVAAAKAYNGGQCKCAQGDIFGLGGQHKYSEQFARATNTFLNLYGESMGASRGKTVLVAGVFAAVGWMIFRYYDPKYKWMQKLRRAVT